MSLKILPYNRYSKSAATLAKALGVLRIVNPGYRQRHEYILNWGNSSPEVRFNQNYRILNFPGRVKTAANKLMTLQELTRHNVARPNFTTSKEEAQRWLENENAKVVVRHLLTAHSGQGIQIVRQGETLPDAPLYTLYTKKTQEYRIHVFNGTVIDVSQKKRKDGHESNPTFNPLIRNHANGWVFCRAEVTPPGVVLTTAIKAVQALGLHFGAVDIGYNEDIATVFEVNTAPGLEGTTLVKYVEALKPYTRRYV